MKPQRRRWFLFLFGLLLVTSACAGTSSASQNPDAGGQAVTWSVTPTWSPLAPLPPTPPSPTPLPLPSPTPSAPVRIAVIGDFGLAGPHEQAVAELVHSWQPDFVVTTGDNNYPNGARETMAANVLQYYGDFVEQHRFFPALGNHDWYSGIAAYLETFDLPGNERYYDVVLGPVHLFVLDSDTNEPDGIDADSLQAQWLRQRLAESTAPWQLVVAHHPPYSSAEHGNAVRLQWPFALWGVDAVLSGHDHTYERILRDGIVYFVNGLGGKSRYSFRQTVEGSQVRYNGDYGAMLVEADASKITFQFINIRGQVIDTYTLTAP